MSRLQKKYQEEVSPKLKEHFNYSSSMQVPKLVKICLNQGIGEATQDKKVIEESLRDMTLIAGQKAVSTKSKKAVSNFKLREGQIIGTRVTLRRRRMYEFLDRLISVSLPRVKDFRGISEKSFDGRGNYSFGITEHTIFPEINSETVTTTRGMDITFVTTAETDAEAFEFLKLMGLPFKGKNN